MSGFEPQTLMFVETTFEDKFFIKIDQPWPLFFVYFCSFKRLLERKTVDFSKIRTQIAGVEGKHDDH